MKNENTVSLEDIKDFVSNNMDRTINIKEENKQGKILSDFTGEIIEIYDSLFIVMVHKNGYHFKKSFSYVDFVTHELHYELI